MSEKQKQIVEKIKRREQEIETMQLILKHDLTRKRTEYKLLIMYYKACNMISKGKLMMMGTDDNDIRAPYIPPIRSDIRQAYWWYEHFERRASSLWQIVSMNQKKLRFYNV